MRAFSVHQPYAYAIVAGLKPHETRSRKTNIRGRVAVHAARRIPEFVSMAAAIALPDPVLLHFGSVIGTVEIVDCLPVEEVIGALTERERALGDYSKGRWAWVLKNPVMFDTPVPAKGKQGWWNWEVS